MMKRNVGGLDRAARIVLGAALILLVVTGSIGAWGWIGAIPLITGLLGSCPLYRIVGINSCPLTNEKV